MNVYSKFHGNPSSDRPDITLKITNARLTVDVAYDHCQGLKDSSSGDHEYLNGYPLNHPHQGCQTFSPVPKLRLIDEPKAKGKHLSYCTELLRC